MRCKGSCKRSVLFTDWRDALRGARWGLACLDLLRDLWASELTSPWYFIRKSVETCSGWEVQTSPRYMFAFWVVRPPSMALHCSSLNTGWASISKRKETYRSWKEIEPIETETPNPDLQQHARSRLQKYRSNIETEIPYQNGRERTLQERDPAFLLLTLWVALLVSSYLSNAASFVLCVCCSRVQDHYNVLHYSPISKKTSVRQVVIDKWLPLNSAQI